MATVSIQYSSLYEGSLLTGVVAGTEVQENAVYQWQRRDPTSVDYVNYATGPTLLLGYADGGAQFRLVVSNLPLNSAGQWWSSSVTAIDLDRTGAVTIYGEASEGNTLTASISDPDGNPGTVSYQWQLKTGENWSNISGATGGTLKLGMADGGEEYRVIVSYSDGQKHTVSNLVGPSQTIVDPTVPIISNIPSGAIPISTNEAVALPQLQLGDEDDDSLLVTLTTSGGTITGINDANDNLADGIQLTGRANAINQAVASGKFVADKDGAASIKIQADDGSNSAVAYINFTASTPNLAPTGITLQGALISLQENQSTSGGMKVADLILADDGIGSNTFGLSGGDAELFQIWINAETQLASLWYNGNTPDFETKSRYDVDVIVQDPTITGSSPVSVSYTLPITDVAEAPRVSITPAILLENATEGALAAEFAVLDQDTADAHFYTLLDDAGGRFVVSGDRLVVSNGVMLDYEQSQSHRITVQVTDSYGLNHAQTLTIAIGNVLNESVIGSAGMDRICGDFGNDTIDGGLDADYMAGGAGNDTYYVDNSGDQVVEASGEGTDTVYASTSYSLSSALEVETLRTTQTSETATIDLTGSSTANNIYGNAGANRLDGKGGADKLYGYGGNDTYYVDNARDRVIEITTGGAADRVYTTVSHTLTAYVENLYASGKASISLTGNTAANIICGNSGANKINGGYGNDTLKGNTGKDTFIFSTKLSSSFNRDTIVDFSVVDDSIYMDNAIFTTLGSGSMSSPRKVSSSYFTVGPAAKDKNDYVIYNKSTGILYYDADGSGSGKAIQVAKLSKSLAMTYSDIYIV